jgi:hypothetical protein
MGYFLAQSRNGRIKNGHRRFVFIFKICDLPELGTPCRKIRILNLALQQLVLTNSICSNCKYMVFVRVTPARLAVALRLAKQCLEEDLGHRWTQLDEDSYISVLRIFETPILAITGGLPRGTFQFIFSQCSVMLSVIWTNLLYILEISLYLRATSKATASTLVSRCLTCSSSCWHSPP